MITQTDLAQLIASAEVECPNCNGNGEEAVGYKECSICNGIGKVAKYQWARVPCPPSRKNPTYHPHAGKCPGYTVAPNLAWLCLLELCGGMDILLLNRHFGSKPFAVFEDKAGKIVNWIGDGDTQEQAILAAFVQMEGLK